MWSVCGNDAAILIAVVAEVVIGAAAVAVAVRGSRGVELVAVFGVYEGIDAACPHSG